MGRKNIKKNEVLFEVRRQLFHIMVGLSLALFLLLYGRTASVILYSIILLFGIYIKYKVEKKKRVKIFSEFLEIFEREKDKENPGKGATYLIIGGLMSVLFFEPFHSFYSIIVIAMADAFSTVVGKYFGKTLKINNKSFLGSLTFFLVTFFVLLVPYGIYISLIAALIAALTEALPKVNDNVSVPVIVGLILQIA